ncbi:MAG: hypothetical protein WC859_00395 [Elusimicrobiota bacterium]|jgi:hypothetical protein
MIDKEMMPPAIRKSWVAGFYVSYVLLVHVLLWMFLIIKGVPSLVQGHPLLFVGWVIETTWLAALIGGGLLMGVTIFLVRCTNCFHHPYDFGRCFSLGAIVGSLAQALGITLQFLLQFHQLPTGFRVGGAFLSGCLAGGLVVAFFLWRLSLKKD